VLVKTPVSFFDPRSVLNPLISGLSETPQQCPYFFTPSPTSMIVSDDLGGEGLQYAADY